MNRNILFRKTLVFIVVVLFFCVSVAPCINAIFYNSGNEKKYYEQIICNIDFKTSNYASVKIFPIGDNHFRPREIVLSVEEVRDIQDCFYNLITSDPFGV